MFYLDVQFRDTHWLELASGFSYPYLGWLVHRPEFGQSEEESEQMRGCRGSDEAGGMETTGFLDPIPDPRAGWLAGARMSGRPLELSFTPCAIPVFPFLLCVEL